MSRILSATQGELRLDLNIAPILNEAAIRRAIEAAGSADLAMYPETEAPQLRAALSKRLGHPIEGIIVGCGSDEIIDLAMRTLVPRGGRIGVLDPSFSIYSHTARSCRVMVENVPTRSELPVAELAGLQADAYFLPSPNNPTGASFPKTAFEALLDRVDGPVVIDEAYAEFARQDLRPLARAYGNALVLRTFSKAYGLPGVRIGYGFGSVDLVERLRSIKMPYNTSSFGERAALAALDDPSYVERTVSLIEEERPQMVAALGAAGWPVWPSKANFLFLGPLGRSREIWTSLRNQGILVKLVEWPGGADGASLRVTIGTREQNQAFLEALREASAWSA